MKELKKSEDVGDLFVKSEGKSQKFVFAEELAAYQALRRESKARSLLKAVCLIKLCIDLKNLILL